MSEQVELVALPHPDGSIEPEAAPSVSASAVVAREVSLHGKRGIVYGPVTCDVAVGDLVILQGPQGAGRSSLLLTIAGRMKPDRASSLEVLGHRLPNERTLVQRLTAIAGFDGIDGLDGSVTVQASIHERLAWLAPWYKRTPKLTPAVYRELMQPVFGERPLPALHTVVWDLDEVDEMLLRIAIALLQEPQLLVVDDLDQVHDQARRQLVWERLESLSADGLTVIASVASENEVEAMTWENEPAVIHLTTGPQAVSHRTRRSLHIAAS